MFSRSLYYGGKQLQHVRPDCWPPLFKNDHKTNEQRYTGCDYIAPLSDTNPPVIFLDTLASVMLRVLKFAVPKVNVGRPGASPLLHFAARRMLNLRRSLQRSPQKRTNNHPSQKTATKTRGKGTWYRAGVRERHSRFSPRVVPAAHGVCVLLGTLVRVVCM